MSCSARRAEPTCCKQLATSPLSADMVPMAAGRGEIDFGLGRVVAALERLGSPQLSLAGRVLHVAGTNGKGSAAWSEAVRQS